MSPMDVLSSERKSSLSKVTQLISRNSIKKTQLDTLNLRSEKLDQEIKQRIISSLNRSTIRRKSLKSLKRRSNFTLDSKNPKLEKIFQNILTGHHLITIQDFEVFLKNRYPESMVEVMINHFDFHSENYEGFVSKMNKFINLTEKEHLKFCFQIYDFNRDGFICYKDTFAALQVRKENLYDDDFILLRELLQLKFEGKLEINKMRRKSTFGLIIERLEKKMKSKIIVPVVNQDCRTKINFSEFRLAKFSDRPQILKDFFRYTCAFNYTKNILPTRKTTKHAIKESENIVIEMSINRNFLEEIMKSEKYHYYCELDEVMARFTESDLKSLLEKFKFLQSKEKFFYKIITKESMLENFVIHIQPKLIGYNNDYLTTRMFEVLSDNHYLTKAKFLSSILQFHNNESSKNINKLSFAVYDSKKSGKITVNEVSDMFKSLLYGSEAYLECLKYLIIRIVDLFLNSIFEKSYKKVNSIEFDHFQEIVGISCIGKELMNFINFPLTTLLNRVPDHLVSTFEKLA